MGLRSLFGGRGGSKVSREDAVRLAAVEAAEDDPLFDSDVVVRRAAALFVAVQRTWSADDVRALGALVGPELMVEWEARLADFRRKGWRNRVDVLDGPQVRYVGVTNRQADREDRVVVLLTAQLRDVVVDRHGAEIPSDDGETARIREFWTLGKRAGQWIVTSIEQEHEGAYHLSAPLIAVPEGDNARLRADAVMEVAAADGVPADELGGMLSPTFDGSARAAALDLSLVDGRLAPDVIATAVAEIVEAWTTAIDGPDAALAAQATAGALRELLYPTAGGRDRLVIRGPEIRSLEIATVTPGPPPEVGVELEVAGVQYVEDRDTTQILAGRKGRSTTTRQRWTLRLSDDPRRPWSVVHAAGVVPR